MSLIAPSFRMQGSTEPSMMVSGLGPCTEPTRSSSRPKTSPWVSRNACLPVWPGGLTPPVEYGKRPAAPAASPGKLLGGAPIPPGVCAVAATLALQGIHIPFQSLLFHLIALGDLLRPVGVPRLPGGCTSLFVQRRAAIDYRRLWRRGCSRSGFICFCRLQFSGKLRFTRRQIIRCFATLGFCRFGFLLGRYLLLFSAIDH